MHGLRARISAFRRSLEVRRAHPTAIIHRDVYIDRASSVGSYNVFFDRVSIIDSSIGDHSYVQQDSQICSASIGKFTSIGMRASVGLPQHPVDFASTHPSLFLLNTPLACVFAKEDMVEVIKRTTLGHDVWLGQGALVMTGVTIGTGAVVGAGAVVTRDVPPYAIAVGAPARVLRFRFDETIRAALLASNWWDMPSAWIREHVAEFQTPTKLLEALKSYKGSGAGEIPIKKVR